MIKKYYKALVGDPEDVYKVHKISVGDYFISLGIIKLNFDLTESLLLYNGVRCSMGIIGESGCNSLYNSNHVVIEGLDVVPEDIEEMFKERMSDPFFEIEMMSKLNHKDCFEYFRKVGAW